MVLLASEFFSGWVNRIIIVLLSCVPIIESRYAIVIGKTLPAFEALNDKTGELFILTQLGAFFVTLVLLLLLRPVIEWMKTIKIFKGFAEWIEKHGKKKSAKLEDKLADPKNKKKKIWISVISVFLFVAIPLPGTGVWTGSLVATILNIRFKYAFPAICIGSIFATTIMLMFSDVFMQAPDWLQMFM